MFNTCSVKTTEATLQKISMGEWYVWHVRNIPTVNKDMLGILEEDTTYRPLLDQ